MFKGLSSWESVSLHLLPFLLRKEIATATTEYKYRSLENLRFSQLWYTGMICSYFFIDTFSYMLWGSRRHVCVQAAKAEYLQFPIFTSHGGTCLPVCVLCLTKLLDSNTKYWIKFFGLVYTKAILDSSVVLLALKSMPLLWTTLQYVLSSRFAMFH